MSTSLQQKKYRAGVDRFDVNLPMGYKEKVKRLLYPEESVNEFIQKAIDSEFLKRTL